MPIWWDGNGGLFWMGVRHGAIRVAGYILQLLVYKVFYGQVLASVLTPRDQRRGPLRLNGWEWQVGFLIRMWLWHGDDW